MRRRQTQSGQALVEWAISAFLLLLFAFSLLAVGHVVGQYMAVRAASSQAAFAAARAPSAQAAQTAGRRAAREAVARGLGRGHAPRPPAAPARRWDTGRVPLKTSRSRRVLAMPRPAVEALRAHRQRQLEERLAASRWTATGYVFATTIGTPLEARNVVRSLKALLQRAGLRDVRFHDLRHSAATLLLVQGVPTRVVMETLGHSQMATTSNTYQHVVPELQREAADRMSAVFS